jgi:hypothetical protein
MTEELFDTIRNCFSCDAYLNDFITVLDKEGYIIIKKDDLVKQAGHIVADTLSKRMTENN